MKNLRLVAFLILSSSFILFNCNKDDDNGNDMPNLQLKNDQGYTYQDVSVNYLDTVKFGILATGNGTDNLKHFIIEVNDQELMDSTIDSQNFNYSFYTLKGPNQTDKWTLKVIDSRNNVAEKSVVLTGIFGKIRNYPEILLGSQNNDELPGFLSLSEAVPAFYNMEEAFNNQAKIDIYCFFDDQHATSLSSPGSSYNGIFSGEFSPENYTVKNLTWFVKTELTASNFEAVQNDGIIRYFYNDNNKKNIAEKLAPGEVYAFRLNSGKLGLLKIIQVNQTTAGSIKVAVKIQE